MVVSECLYDGSLRGAPACWRAARMVSGLSSSSLLRCDCCRGAWSYICMVCSLSWLRLLVYGVTGAECVGGLGRSLEPPVLITFQLRVCNLSLCTPQSDLWQSPLLSSKRTSFFTLLAESLIPGELYREEKSNIKQGIKTLGVWTWIRVTFLNFRVSPAGLGEKCGISLG